VRATKSGGGGSSPMSCGTSSTSKLLWHENLRSAVGGGSRVCFLLPLSTSYDRILFFKSGRLVAPIVSEISGILNTNGVCIELMLMCEYNGLILSGVKVAR
jgi:hypothetical protein